jgi:hypothetical protein
MPIQVPIPEQPVLHHPIPVPVSSVPIHQGSLPVQTQPSCAAASNKVHLAFWWGEVLKYAHTQLPSLQPHVPFHQQVPLFTPLQGF